MRRMSWRLPWAPILMLLGLLAAAIVLHACRDAPAPDTPAALVLADDGTDTWQDVAAGLDDDAQRCIRAALGPDWAAAAPRPVLDAAPAASWETAIFACLAPEQAYALFHAARRAANDIAVPELGMPSSSAAEPGADPTAAPPDGSDGLPPAQRACLEDWVVDLAAEAGDDALAVGLFACLPELFLPLLLASLETEGLRPSAAEAACLEAWAADLDPADLAAALTDDDPEALILPGILACLPAWTPPVDAIEAPVDEIAVPDDHGDDPDGATPVALDRAAAGRIAPAEDRDLFTFDAVAGVLYRIDVVGDTLPDPMVILSGPDFEWLADDDDGGEGLAARLHWEAPAAGAYFLAVESSFFGDTRTGTYTLTVTAVDTADDHGNAPASASAVALGAPLMAVIDYETDVDVFAFDAVAGALYQIDVVPDTLADPVVTLSGPDGEWLAEDDDGGEGLGARLYWEAPAAGRYYVEVRSVAWSDGPIGSYTLTIRAR